ncbi:glycosyltransferase [Geopsychrobacter electrodiphilus]|uniref:glycosyltransferase n=1 Tax=Geopsychrobacter electrodiphilus TaxID=225196 RepID=UPI00037B89BB|nr:glycosyltransferase [Geopsychrobacter electrodiphilus]
MNICMFTNTFLPHVGGVARSVATFAEDLRQRGHQVLVVAPNFPGQDPTIDSRNQVVRVPAIQNFNGSDFSVRVLLPGQFKSQLDRFAPDIIHSHHPFLLGDAAIRTARIRHLPVVFTHHTLHERYTHYVPFDSPLMQRFVIDLATRFANLCQLVIAPSESIAALLKTRGVSTPCRVIPTGVDTDYFSRGDGQRFRHKQNIAADAFVLGHLGRLAPEKNLNYLTAAAIKACRSVNNRVFLIAGNGPSKKQICHDFAVAGLAERLVMAGDLQGTDLPDCYAAMDLFLFASTSETQGMVLTEAMAAGRPVIALDAPGVRDVVSDRINGRLLPQSATVSDFVSAISTAAATAQGLSAWQKQALRTAVKFSRQSSTERLEAVYREALELKRNHHAKTLAGWDTLRESLHAEWNLISSKCGAAFDAVRDRPDHEEQT